MAKFSNSTRWGRFLLLAAWLFAASASHARTIHVAKDGSGADGQTWETAYITITDAVIASATGDSIWVKAGVYEEAIARSSGWRGSEGGRRSSSFRLMGRLRK